MIRYLLPVISIFLVLPVFSQEPEAFKCSGNRIFNQDRFDTHLRHPLLEGYDVKYYEINLSVTDTSTYIEGYGSLLVEILQTGLDTIILELTSNLLVDSVQINGQVVPSFHHQDDLLGIPSSRSFTAGERITVGVYYRGSYSGTGFFSGITNALDVFWNKRVTYTLSESFHSKDWFPCKQVLTDKADSAFIIITTPPGRMAGSNGLLQRVTEQPDGRLTWEWLTRHPVAYYLLSVTVADYLDYSIYARPEEAEKPVLVQNFIYNDSAYLSANRELIDKTAAMIELFSDLFTVYPFKDEKYGHCVAPMGGGMEHQTMTSLSGFNFDLVAHELGHQWFGDNVTCATWQDIWINEGFASYTEYLCREYLISEEAAHEWMEHAHSRAFTEPEGSIFIPSEDADNESRIFSSALSYKKGAAILHMIRHEMNEDSLFFQVLRDYQNRYRNGVATALDFKTVLEQTSGKDFDWFFEQWFFGKGFPVNEFVWWQTSDSLTIFNSQNGSSAETPFFRTRIDFRVVFIDGTDTLLSVEQTTNEQYFRFVMPAFVWAVIPDPDNWILDQSTITEKLTHDHITINPNPFQEELILKFLTDNVRRQIILSDLQGKVHGQFTSEARVVSIPTRNLIQGLYLVTVKEGRDKYTAKLIKY